MRSFGYLSLRNDEAGADVVLTDYDDKAVLEFMHKNIKENKLEAKMKAFPLVWYSAISFFNFVRGEEIVPSIETPFDIVIGSDLVYDEDVIEAIIL